MGNTAESGRWQVQDVRFDDSLLWMSEVCVRTQIGSKELAAQRPGEAKGTA